MWLFKDRFTDVEYFTDSVKVVLKDDFYYESDGLKLKDTVGQINTGANASADNQGDDEDVADAEKEIIAQEEKLTETSFTKKELVSYIKTYMKKIKERILEEEGEEKSKEFEEKASEFFKNIILKNFKNWNFFWGIADDEGKTPMIVFKDFREDGATPYYIHMKDGMVQEKL